jgi:hypothetical protein
MTPRTAQLNSLDHSRLHRWMQKPLKGMLTSLRLLSSFIIVMIAIIDGILDSFVITLLSISHSAFHAPFISASSCFTCISLCLVTSVMFRAFQHIVLTLFYG